MEAVRIASVAPDDNRAAKLHPTFGASIARDCAVVGSAVAWAGSDGPLVGGNGFKCRTEHAMQTV